MNKKTSENHGQKIKKIIFPNQEEMRPRADLDEEMVLSHEYYGDHAENWILKVQKGKEILRVNAVYVETIIWMEDEN